MYLYVAACICMYDAACLFIILYVYPSVVYDISCCYPLMCTPSHTRVSICVSVRVCACLLQHISSVWCKKLTNELPMISKLTHSPLPKVWVSADVFVCVVVHLSMYWRFREKLLHVSYLLKLFFFFLSYSVYSGFRDLMHFWHLVVVICFCGIKVRYLLFYLGICWVHLIGYFEEFSIRLWAFLMIW